MKFQSVSGELDLALGEIARKEKDFREMHDERNNIASMGRVMQSTIDELRWRMQIWGRRYWEEGS